MSAPTTFYTDNMAYIDRVCDAYVGQNVAAVAQILGPLLFSMLGLSAVIFFFATARGMIQQPMNAMIHKFIVIAIILLIGFNTANYNTLLTNTFLRGPDELIGGLAGTPGKKDVISGLDVMFDLGFEVGSRFWAKAGIFDGDPGFYMVAGMVYGTTIIVTGYGFGLMALAKICMTCLLAIGPIFFIGLLFEATMGFFNSWLRQMANYFLVPVLVVAVNLLVLTLFSRAASGAAAMKNTTEVGQIFPFLAMGLLSLLALASVLTIAAALAGGVSLSSFGMGRFAARLLGHTVVKGIPAGTRTAAAPIKIAARKTWKAVGNLRQNSVKPSRARRPTAASSPTMATVRAASQKDASPRRATSSVPRLPYKP